MSFAECYRPLVEATRGPLVESIHFGAATVVDAAGRVIASVGDPNLVTYMRSSMKPLQVLSLVEAGGLETYHFNDQELAVMCASHVGTDQHVAVVTGAQEKINIKESDMLCGTHPPYDSATLKAMILRGEEPSPRRHNCSGKHTGMLAGIRLRHFPIEDYLNPEHPMQKIILKTCAEMWSLSPENIPIGIDGCSAPVFAVPLYNAALGFARLCDPSLLSLERATACRRVVKAMTSYPEMIAGHGYFDTEIMKAGEGMLVSKLGAEGFQSLGILPGVLSPNSPGLGIAIKISDGDSTDRARAVASLEILRQLEIFSAKQFAKLEKFAARPTRNWRGLEIGELRPCFTLEKNI